MKNIHKALKVRQAPLYPVLTNVDLIFTLHLRPHKWQELPWKPPLRPWSVFWVQSRTALLSAPKEEHDFPELEILGLNLGSAPTTYVSRAKFSKPLSRLTHFC